jgi:hypothetical protein
LPPSTYAATPTDAPVLPPSAATATPTDAPPLPPEDSQPASGCSGDSCNTDHDCGGQPGACQNSSGMGDCSGTCAQ